MWSEFRIVTRWIGETYQGIGLILMTKMGYIPGQGLGAHGDEVLKPVEALSLPKNLNLDGVMSIQPRSARKHDEEVQTIDTEDKRNNINFNAPTKSIDVIEILSDSDSNDLCELQDCY
ncbi:Zinc finger, CCCH-type with G patch domain protein [Oopsacas minuta]|uniref:Zinc finger, CCCH-type with G patch domain protein n=1 Tax=Oopsacas minuta TaxID=111878 RepID=A0AAV7JB94_9METZ|nr:Zinc finger, CCCH-type with G patch domain protein [Oopsacas minuta]